MTDNLGRGLRDAYADGGRDTSIWITFPSIWGHRAGIMAGAQGLNYHAIGQRRPVPFLDIEDSSYWAALYVYRG